ncbi:hypothetical protein PLESTB_000831400 [Pleodorina starrii]|uniref:GATA-type domain-containing protein n=1 Tax=Pleodorina starrii TaxID=330485 RepID=A0A9W6BMA8_9CHLO|nr:hypothetical protein PLESTM_000147300 [Pleodorina starrii]GLC54172.1 hypothetical protein PLESTB_000831400 [Pleodorina starrii]GLC64527.1 hypothetical protein PLESTF_000175500 [Pleodorina starrii]
MAMLYRVDSFPPSEGFKYIDTDLEDARCVERLLESSAATSNSCKDSLETGLPPSRPPVPVACGVRCDNERDGLHVAPAAASPAQAAAVYNKNISSAQQETVAGCNKSPFCLPSVQHSVMDTTDADLQPAAAEDGAWAEDVIPHGSCDLGRSLQRQECLPVELPVAPAEPAPSAPAKAAAALPERGSTSALLLAVDVDAVAPAAELADGNLAQQRPLMRATQAASSVCRTGPGDEDTDDGDDDAAEITTTAAAAAATAAKGLKQKSSGCLSAVTRSEQATSMADDEMSEIVDSMEVEEPQLSVRAASPQADMPPATASEALRIEGPSRHLMGVEDGYTSATVAESPRSGRGEATRQVGRPLRRGRSAAAAPPATSGRGVRRAAAGAAEVMAAVAVLDVVAEDEEVEVELDREDGDEEYDVRGRPGNAGVKRRRNGAKGGRTAGRLVSGNYCRECRITETPQWRQGPEGPRTLCNACGVRYKKEQGPGGRRREMRRGAR